MRLILLATLLLGACAEGSVRSQEVDLDDAPGREQQAPGVPSLSDPAGGGEGGAGGGPGSAGGAGGQGGSAEPPPPPVDPLHLVVTEPLRGSWLYGPTIRVTGQLTGGAAPTLTVAGEPVTPDASGRFSVEVPAAEGLNVVVTEARDGNRRAEDRRAVLQDADIEPGSLVDRGAVIEVAASGFDAISGLLSDFVSGLDLNSLIAGNLPENVSVEELRYDRIEVQLEPADGHLRVRLRIWGLYVRMRGEVTFGFTVGFTGSATSNPAEITARVRLSPTPDGSLGLEVLDAEVMLHDFGYDIRGVPGVVEGWFSDRVREFAEGLVRDALNEFVLPTLFDPSALDRSFEVFGRPIEVGLRIRRVDLRSTGMELEMAARVEAENEVHEGPAVRPLGGRPDMSDAQDVDVALGADFVSRVLHAAWAGGMLDFTLDADSGIETPVPLTIGLLAPALGEAAQGLDRAAPLVISTRPLLPAVARVEKGERPLVIEAADLLLDLGTAEGTVATVAIHLVARASITIESLGDIVIHPDFEVEVFADVAETPRGPVNDIRLEEQVRTFAALIPPLVAGQTFTFGADALPVPLSLRNVVFDADRGAPFVHLRADIER